MLYGFFQWPAMLPAVGKCPCNADRSHRVQPVRILYHFCLDCFRPAAFILTEGCRINDLTDPVDHLFWNLILFQKSPRIRIILRRNQIVVIRIMKKAANATVSLLQEDSVSAIMSTFRYTRREWDAPCPPEFCRNSLRIYRTALFNN